MKKKQKLYKRMISLQMAVLFAGILLLTFVVNEGKKEREFSELENRALAGKPKVTLSGVAGGTYMKQYEEYRTDQFAGRDFWVSLKTKAEYFTGKRESNGVYKGKNHYLLEKPAAPDAKEYNRNLQSMQAFRKKYQDRKMYLLLVPNAANVLADKLPFLAVTEDQKEQLAAARKSLGKDFQWIDARKILYEHREEEIYYHTDHHWTTLGAYYTYLEAVKVMGKKEPDYVPFRRYLVSDNFRGTLSAKSGYERKYRDRIHVYLPEGRSSDVVVNYVEEQKKSASMYETSALKTRDQYEVFFGGNHALIDIRTKSASQDRLLVFKDSYANCFLPFLIPYYREIVVVDPRYYYGDLDGLMGEKKITEVLFLYNANTFLQDHNISGVLADE